MNYQPRPIPDTPEFWVTCSANFLSAMANAGHKTESKPAPVAKPKSRGKK